MSQTYPIRLGTSGFSAEGWVGTFYPEKTAPKEYLRTYAQKLDTVEVDSTFYRIPTEKSVLNWYEQTPDGFVFAAKVPQIVTHERCLEDCDTDMQEFLRVMATLREKLGPLLLQFPYYGMKSGMNLNEFVGRLNRFLPKLPQDWKFAVEIRNKAWLSRPLLDLLRRHRVALARVDHPYMPRPVQTLGEDLDTAGFAYSRLLGDRHEIEEITKTWGQTVVEKSQEIDEWVEVTKTLQKRVPVYTYVNNHFAGHAPATVRELKKRLGLETSEPIMNSHAQGFFVGPKPASE